MYLDKVHPYRTLPQVYLGKVHLYRTLSQMYLDKVHLYRVHPPMYFGKVHLYRSLPPIYFGNEAGSCVSLRAIIYFQTVADLAAAVDFEGYVWTVDMNANAIYKFDPDTETHVTVPVGLRPYAGWHEDDNTDER